jgi:hypothetical protein
MRHTDRATVYKAAADAGLSLKTRYDDESRMLEIERLPPAEEVYEMLTGQAAMEASQRVFSSKNETRGRKPRPTDEMTQKEKDVVEWRRILRIDPSERSEAEHEFMEYIHVTYQPHEMH